MDYNVKKQLVGWLKKEIAASGLSQNDFAVQKLNISKAQLSNLLNKWEELGVIGGDIWSMVEKMYSKSGYKGVPTYNFKRVCEACETAYATKKAVPVIGEGGFGKTYALNWFADHQTRKRGYKVWVFDASEFKTKKQFVVGLMVFLACYEPGVIGSQMAKIGETLSRLNGVLVIDEVSSLRDHHVTIIKDVITVAKGETGIVLAGTQYFEDNLNKGAARHKHLYSETRDRLFSLRYQLRAPEDDDAEAIFKANGITGEALSIVMGKNKPFSDFHWRKKPTYRGISDCVEAVKVAFSDSKIEYPTIID